MYIWVWIWIYPQSLSSGPNRFGLKKNKIKAQFCQFKIKAEHRLKSKQVNKTMDSDLTIWSSNEPIRLQIWILALFETPNMRSTLCLMDPVNPVPSEKQIPHLTFQTKIQARLSQFLGRWSCTIKCCRYPEQIVIGAFEVIFTWYPQVFVFQVQPSECYQLK